MTGMRCARGPYTRRIVDRCRETGVEFKIIPSIDDLLKKRATIDQLRDVAIEDLLGRAPVHLNLEQIKQDLAGKSILVTGGAGSIGSELARQIASYGPARLDLRSEEHTSELQSRLHLVCRLLLGKKKINHMRSPQHTHSPPILPVHIEWWSSPPA